MHERAAKPANGKGKEASKMKERQRLTVKEQVTLPTYGFFPYVSPDSSKVMYLKVVPNLKTNGVDV
jgi:hypothetical protein